MSEKRGSSKSAKTRSENEGTGRYPRNPRPEQRGRRPGGEGRKADSAGQEGVGGERKPRAGVTGV